MTIAAGSFQSTISYVGGGGPEASWATVIGVRPLTGGIAEAEEAVDLAVQAAIIPLISSGLIVTSIKTESEGEVSVRPIQLIGLNNGDQCPSNCALLVNKVTGVKGRANRGRMFLPGALPENEVSDDGRLSTSYQTACQTTMDLFLSTLQTNDCDMVILHQSTATATLVKSLEVQSVIASQRDRLR